MKKCLFVMLIGCLLVPLTPSVLALQYATFTGTITIRDGGPASDAMLTLVHEARGEKKVKIKKDGTFKSRLFETGKYTFKISAPGYLVYAIKHMDAGPTGIPQEAEHTAVGAEQELPTLQVSPNHTYTYDFILAPEEFFAEAAAKEKLGKVQNDILKAEEKINAGDYAGAIEFIEKAIEKKPDLGYPFYLRGVVHLEQGQLEAAKADFQKAVEIKSDLIGANYYLGKMAYDSGNMDDAVRYFESELVIQPKQPATLQSLGVIYRDRGENAKSAEMFERFRILRPDDEKVLNELIVLYTDLGDDKKVKEIVEAQEELGQQDASSYYNLGTSYWNEKDYPASENAFRKAVEKDPALAPAHKGLGYCLIQLKKNREALTHLEKYIELQPDAKDKGKILDIIKELKDVLK